MSTLLDRLLEWDRQAFLSLNHWLHERASTEPEVAAVLRVANEVGNGWALVLVGVGIIGLERSFRRGLRRYIEMGTATFAAGYGAHLIKKALDRPRPQKALADAFERGDVVIGFGEIFRGASFPSGHTACAFATVVVLSYWAGAIPDAWRRWVVRIFLFVFAALTGVARIYGGAHYPLDVLGGALLGILCGSIVAWISKRVGPYPPARLPTG